MTFQECCNSIIAHQDQPSLNYAVGYAKAGRHMTDPHEIRVQALYILNNMSYWRGDIAKEVRASLKKIGG